MDLLTVCLFVSTGITTGGVMVVQEKVEKQKEIEKSTEKPSLYAVTYEYAYSNKNLVQYDVGFDKAGGSTKIRSFDVKLYGASTD